MKQLAAVIAISLFTASSFRAAEPAANAQDQQIVALVKTLQAQNVAMAQNQATIEAKLATVAEAVRQARVFTSGRGLVR
ncbi:MAG: hypothetical protein ABR526_00230 [Chthoniobacterales bacterium]